MQLLPSLPPAGALAAASLSVMLPPPPPPLPPWSRGPRLPIRSTRAGDPSIAKLWFCWCAAPAGERSSRWPHDMLPRCSELVLALAVVEPSSSSSVPAAAAVGSRPVGK